MKLGGESSFFNLGAERRRRGAEAAPEIDVEQVVGELDNEAARVILSEIEEYKRQLKNIEFAGGDVSPEDREKFRQINEHIDAQLSTTSIEIDDEDRQKAYDALYVTLTKKLEGPAQEAA